MKVGRPSVQRVVTRPVCALLGRAGCCRALGVPTRQVPRVVSIDVQELDTESYGNRGEERRGAEQVFLNLPQKRGGACRSQVSGAALMFFIRLQASADMKGLWVAGVKEGYDSVYPGVIAGNGTAREARSMFREATRGGGSKEKDLLRLGR